ncbi:hypothetical protein PoB_000165300 [Plakobranchus ocellatus]|uniref:Uncharacterized protein n=1 Tax=Plakobranchus ocellatus TaxID=259542 RepID=A0AAV3XY44_9GAST|nr:hypothetical protein PoB_000165300 [Plakobranchus ocellatus]
MRIERALNHSIINAHNYIAAQRMRGMYIKFDLGVWSTVCSLLSAVWPVLARAEGKGEEREHSDRFKLIRLTRGIGPVFGAASRGHHYWPGAAHCSRRLHLCVTPGMASVVNQTCSRHCGHSLTFHSPVARITMHYQAYCFLSPCQGMSAWLAGMSDRLTAASGLLVSQPRSGLQDHISQPNDLSPAAVFSLSPSLRLALSNRRTD